MTCPWGRGLQLSMIAALSVAACHAGGRAVSPDVPTLAVENHEYNVERHRNQTIRVCGRVVKRDSRWAVEHVPTPGEFFFHGYPAVFVVPCGAGPPQLDRDGCLVGRVAAEDGSLNPPPQVLDSDEPVSYQWFLHPQCPPRQR